MRIITFISRLALRFFIYQEFILKLLLTAYLFLRFCLFLGSGKTPVER